MDFYKWLGKAIYDANINCLYNQNIRGIEDIETIKSVVKLNTLVMVKEVYEDWSRGG